MRIGFSALLDRANEQWRNHFLTGVTVVMTVHLFIISPLDYFIIKPINVIMVVMLAPALLVLARSIISAALLLLFLILLVTAFVVEIHGGSDMLTIRIRGGAWVLMALAIMWIVARTVYAPGQITYHRVVGATMLYLTIGVLFAALYAFLSTLTPDAFRGLATSPHVSLHTEVVYFSFVTLTTVGYGDIIPLDPLIRSLSNLEAIIGQLYPATVIARLVSLQQRFGASAKKDGVRQSPDSSC
jgi:voltage-gated potassium channel Kch